MSKCWGVGAMSEERTGCNEAKERSASRLRVEPPLADIEPVGRWMATAGSRWSGGGDLQASQTLVADGLKATVGIAPKRNAPLKFDR